MISNSSIKNYNIDGVVVLRNIVNIKWINILKRGLRKNFQNPSKYTNVFMSRIIKKNYFMLITVTGIR